VSKVGAIGAGKDDIDMAIPERVKTTMKKEGLTAVNKAKTTPDHPTKSHVVMAKDGDTYKLIRFGQQGVKGSPEGTKRNEAFKARHAANIAKGKLSAAAWAAKVKW